MVVLDWNTGLRHHVAYLTARWRWAAFPFYQYAVPNGTVRGLCGAPLRRAVLCVFAQPRFPRVAAFTVCGKMKRTQTKGARSWDIERM